MKRASVLLFLSVLLAVRVAAAAAKPIFTAVAVDADRHIYAAAKKQEKGRAMESRLFEVGAIALERHEIKLPSELVEREIVAMVPSKGALYVVTQLTAEQGDAPALHRYERKTQTWKKIGVVRCSTFDSLRVSAGKIELVCEGIGARTFEIKGEASFAFGFVKLPQAEGKRGDLAAILEGHAFEWESLKIRAGSRQKTLSAE